MGVTTRRFRWSSLPGGLLGMLVLVVGVETFVRKNDDTRFTGNNCAELEWKTTGRAVRVEARRSQVLCFGDSLVKIGVAPGILEKRLGKRAYNFALSGGHAPASYFMLRRALDAGARPAAILVDFKWTLLSADYRGDFRLLPEIIGPREMFELAWTARDAAYFGQLLLSWVFPSVKTRFEIRTNVRDALIAKAWHDKRIENVIHLRTWKANRGSEHAPKRPDYKGTFSQYDALMFLPSWNSHKVNRTYVKRFLALAARRQIPVFWLMPPVLPQSQARLEESGTNATYTKFVRLFQKRYANVVVVDGRHAGFPSSVFFDPTHMDRDGTAAFSLALTEVARPRLESHDLGPRWVDLPAYRAAPADVPLEDYGQSTALVLDKLLRVRR